MRHRSVRFSVFTAAAVVLGGLVVTIGQSNPSKAPSTDLTVLLSAPLSTQPWIGSFMERGARLAIDQVNVSGGFPTPAGRHRMRLEVRDNRSAPSAALADARLAISEGAVLLLTDGTGASAVAGLADTARLPVVICFDGGSDLIDPAAHPSMFRMSPQNTAMARRLADFVANAHPSMAIVSDDSDYGQQGRAELRRSFAFDQVRIASDQEVPSSASDLSPQVLAARRAGADRLVIWASAANVAGAVQAARGNGWDVPIFAGPTGEDPLVRQQLAAHPDWVTGLTFVSFRITSEVGPGPYAVFRKAFEARFGQDDIGVRMGGRRVITPPDWAMFTYDTVKLAAAAFSKEPPTAAGLEAGLNKTVITGANGDERGYEPTQHEGVNPSDMYFAQFSGFVFSPVTNDPLSGTLSPVDQFG